MAGSAEPKARSFRAWRRSRMHLRKEIRGYYTGEGMQKEKEEEERNPAVREVKRGWR
jgi:hypothetical protein